MVIRIFTDDGDFQHSIRFENFAEMYRANWKPHMDLIIQEAEEEIKQKQNG